MHKTLQRQDAQKTGRKTLPSPDLETPALEGVDGGALDSRIQGMMDSLKDDLFAKIDTVAVSLQFEI